MTEALHSKSTTALHCYVSVLTEDLKIWRGALISTMSFKEITALPGKIWRGTCNPGSTTPVLLDRGTHLMNHVNNN